MQLEYIGFYFFKFWAKQRMCWFYNDVFLLARFSIFTVVHLNVIKNQFR